MDNRTLHDSGERRTFVSGAQRDRGKLKPRPDLISPHAQMREGIIFALGAEKYDTRNWEKGMPISECVASAQRHIEQAKRGDTDEDHWAQARWNLGAIIHYEEEIKAGRLPVEFDDMPKYCQRSTLTPAACSDEANIRRRERLLKRIDSLIPICPRCGAALSGGPYETGLEYFCNECRWSSLDPEPKPGDRRMGPNGPEVYMGPVQHVNTPKSEGQQGITLRDMDNLALTMLKSYPFESMLEYHSRRIKDLMTLADMLSNVPTFYICGPMRGLPFFNFPAFDGARNYGLSLGFNIISPADLDREDFGFDPSIDIAKWETYKLEHPNFVDELIDRDYAAIRGLNIKRGDGLAILPEWGKSKGANAEIALARWRGLCFVDARTWEPLLDMQL